jgi:predicted ribonuclease YlaK
MNEMRENIYVLDTCVLINDPEIFGKLGYGQIVIPTAVIKELDCLKKNPDPKEPRAMAARKVARTLDTLGSSQNIASGAKTSMGSTVRIINRYVPIDDLASNADNRIVGTALKMKEETQGRVILVSTDGNMRNVTRSYGIEATSYPLYQKSLASWHERLTQKRRAHWNIIVAAAVIILLVLVLGAR